MHSTRRGILGLALAAGLASPAIAQARTLRIVVPYPPGGGADLLARALLARVTARTGRTAIVENRGGATGTIGATAVARAAADGETILQGDSATMVVQPVAKQLPYTAADFAPIARLTTNPVLLAAKVDGPFRTLADVVARAKSAPSAVSVGTSGILSHFHISLERFGQVIGAEFLHIPFQGTPPGVIAVLAGQVDLVVLPPGPVADPSTGRQLRALGVMTPERLRTMPEVPTFREQGVDLVSLAWRGLLAPRGTPEAALDTVEGWVLEAFRDEAFVHQVEMLGETPDPMDRAAFTAFLDEERAVMRDIVRRIGPV